MSWDSGQLHSGSARNPTIDALFPRIMKLEEESSSATTISLLHDFIDAHDSFQLRDGLFGVTGAVGDVI